MPRTLVVVTQLFGSPKKQLVQTIPLISGLLFKSAPLRFAADSRHVKSKERVLLLLLFSLFLCFLSLWKLFKAANRSRQQTSAYHQIYSEFRSLLPLFSHSHCFPEIVEVFLIFIYCQKEGMPTSLYMPALEACQKA